MGTKVKGQDFRLQQPAVARKHPVIRMGFTYLDSSQGVYSATSDRGAALLDELCQQLERHF